MIIARQIEISGRGRMRLNLKGSDPHALSRNGSDSYRVEAGLRSKTSHLQAPNKKGGLGMNFSDQLATDACYNRGSKDHFVKDCPMPNNYYYNNNRTLPFLWYSLYTKKPKHSLPSIFQLQSPFEQATMHKHKRIHRRTNVFIYLAFNWLREIALFLNSCKIDTSILD